MRKEEERLGADYILDNCKDSDEDRQSYGQWYNKMQYASERAMEV